MGSIGKNAFFVVSLDLRYQKTNKIGPLFFLIALSYLQQENIHFYLSYLTLSSVTHLNVNFLHLHIENNNRLAYALIDINLLPYFPCPPMPSPPPPFLPSSTPQISLKGNIINTAKTPPCPYYNLHFFPRGNRYFEIGLHCPRISLCGFTTYLFTGHPIMHCFTCGNPLVTQISWPKFFEMYPFSPSKTVTLLSQAVLQ